MAQLIVRDVDGELVARLKVCAARHGRSDEDEHREILRQALAEALRRSFKELAAAGPPGRSGAKPPMGYSA